jgi:WD40 repeat protein
MPTSLATSQTIRTLLYGHGCRELWGLASHPTKDEFATTGDDATLRIWDAKNFTLLRTIALECASQAVAYSPDGQYIAVGLGSSRQENKKARSTSKSGGYVILSAKNYSVLHQARDSNEAIRTIKFSADSKSLALGSFDSQIYTYKVPDNFSRRATISGVHMAPVVNLDYSVAGDYIMSVDATRRMVFTETSSGVNIPSAAALRDERWATWSSHVGWPIQGLWLSQPRDCAPSTSQRSFNGQLLATGNTGGRVYITHYPCQSQAGFSSAGGHAGPVSKLCWLPGDSSVVSIGQKDYSIFQWKVLYADSKESGDEGGLSCDDSAAENEVGFESRHKEEGPYEALDMTDKQSIVCPPSDMIEADESSPRVDTRLEYVHGIRISDCRQNIRYNSDGSLVFISVTVGIVFSRVEQTQLVYRGHNKALISFDVDKAGSLACSGEQGSDPEVHVWDARTAGAIMQFKGIHRRGVGSVAFSASGEYLVTMGMDMMHSIVVLRSPSKRWADGYVQCSASVSRRRMLWCTFSENNEYPIAVGGSRAMYFFKFKGRNIEREKGTFGRRKKIQPLLCAAVTQYDVNGAVLDSVITGTVTGHIYVWNDKRIAKTAFGHDSAITSIAGISKGNFATGCKDGFVKIWNANLEQLKSFQVPLFTPQPESFAVHALRANSVGSRMTVGMRSGELYEISLSTKTYSQLFDGHSRNRLRGLAANPADGDQYASCGDDGVVRVWSIATRKCLRSTNLECACRCLAYSPDGRRLVVGIGGDATQATKDGAFFILEAASLETVQEDRKAKFCIESIKYSPMTGVIAMASMDGKVFIHDALTYALKRTLFPKARKCTMGVVDFSEDGTALRYAPNHEELFYYDVGSGEAITTTSMTRDILWDTYSCPYTWTTQGITRPAAEGALITSTALNALKTLVAVSYTDGTVRIYRYPCLTQTSGYVEVTGLASFASELDFSADGKYLVVLDTLTRSVMQYVMVYTHE